MRNEKLGYKNNIKSIAIGSFDGIHVAHQALIDRVNALVIIERGGGYLTPGYKRSRYTTKMCCFYHFDVIKNLTPEYFVKKLKTDFPKLEKIVVGYDFAFGKDKIGTAETLNGLFDGKVEIVPEISIEGISVHSRTIKGYLREGKIDLANRLLGRKYCVEGRIISGQGLGKKKLVPTLNFNIKEYQLPLEGVYATRVYIGDAWLTSVSFIGHRVTTDGSYAVESHVLDKDIGSVEGIVKIEFVGFIRNNQKFESLAGLKCQIVDDIDRARSILC